MLQDGIVELIQSIGMDGNDRLWNKFWLVTLILVVGCEQKSEEVYSGEFGNHKVYGRAFSYYTLTGLENGDWLIIYPGEVQGMHHESIGKKINIIIIESDGEDKEFLLSSSGAWILDKPPIRLNFRRTN